MAIHIHTLSGCSPTPLAHYLKALGVLRLVAEQKDATARGWWRNETFHLATSLTRDELERFFLDEYQPTPLLTPWNAGSGFYKNWDAKSERFRNSVAFNSLVRMQQSKAAKFENYRRTIQLIRAVIDEAAIDIDVTTIPKKELGELMILPGPEGGSTRGIDKDAGKEKVIRRVFQVLPSEVRSFFESVFALTLDIDDPKKVEANSPPLWGTGGNDGKMEFTNNQMRRLLELFDADSGKATTGAPTLLRAALWLEPVALAAVTPASQKDDKERSIGMFLPSDAGGPNMTTGFDADSQFNLWDYVLMLEGAVAFSTAVSRRTTTARLAMANATAPFSMYASGIGSRNLSMFDERTKKSVKTEQWMPLWNRPVGWRELQAFIAEGRCQIGNAPAMRSSDVARAISRLGVARGVSEFSRFAFVERNGQSNFATPVGRWRVPDQPVRHADLLDDVASWIQQVKQSGQVKNAPKTIGLVARVCENAMLDCCREQSVVERSDAARWQRLFIALGEAEAQLVRSPGFTGKNVAKGLQPLGAFTNRLNPRWLTAINDRSPELRLALAFAAQHGIRVRESGVRFEIDLSKPIRGHFLPLEVEESKKRWGPQPIPRKFATSGEKLRQDTRVVCVVGDIERDGIALVRRRIIEARQSGVSCLPLRPVDGTEASLSDILRFLSGELDAAKILDLARPLMALRWEDLAKEVPTLREELGSPSDAEERDAAGSLALFGLLRLCHHWGPVPVSNADPVAVRLDPAIFARLMVGGIQQAVEIAVQRLSASGLRPKLRTAIGTEFDGRRLAAALAFPISKKNARELASRLTRPVLSREGQKEEVMASP